MDHWRIGVRSVFGPELKQVLLDHKVSALLDVVAEALGAILPPSESTQTELARAMEHGVLRAEQGFSVGQVIREFSLLRKAIRAICIEEGEQMTEEALSIMVEVIDTAAAIGLARLSERREEMIKEETARKMSFIVHDFRTPLGAIALAATETLDTIPAAAKTPEMMESLTSIERNVEQLSIGMEQTMRELAKVFLENDRLQITNVRLYDVSADVIENLTPMARTKNVILLNEVDAAAEVAAERDALHRILMNLLSNALRYTRDGEISIASSKRGSNVEVVVKDTGRGILPAKLARIFEPGQKGVGSPGMGFGLAIAKYLLELQGGSIRLESAVEKGTTAIFTLPSAAYPEETLNQIGGATPP